MKPLDADTLSPALRQIKENTAWRLKVIQWRIDAEEQAASLISQKLVELFDLCSVQV